MNRSDRRPVIQAAVGTLSELDGRLTDLLHALTDATDRNETGRRAVGGHADPTLGRAVTLVAGTQILDGYLEQINAATRGIHALMARHFGPEHQPKTAHDPALEDWCGSCYRVTNDHGRKVTSAAEYTVRVVDQSSGGTAPWRLCRWCARFHRETGRLPAEDEVQLHSRGVRVYRQEAS